MGGERVREWAQPTSLRVHTGCACGGGVVQDGSWLPGSGRPELYINNGDQGKLRGRALWLLRNVDEGAAVDLTKVSCACHAQSCLHILFLLRRGVVMRECCR